MDDRYGDRRARRRVAQTPRGARCRGSRHPRPRRRGRRGRILRRSGRRRVRPRRARGPAGPAPSVPARTRVSRRRRRRRAHRAARDRGGPRAPRGRHPVRSRRPDARARIARASRILVEGRHDAELVEKVWGDDLRAEGVVVEYLQGIDLLEAALDDEPPSAERRYGVLVDHLVAGSKESRIADAVARGRHGAHVRIVGHPYVDVWQCVTPRALGIARWPDVPRGIEFKVGVCRALGWPVRRPGRHGPRVAADPRRGLELPRPRAGPARPGRGAHRLRDRTDRAARAHVGAAVVSLEWVSDRRRPAAFRERPVSFVRRSGRMSDGPGARVGPSSRRGT